MHKIMSKNYKKENSQLNYITFWFIATVVFFILIFVPICAIGPTNLAIGTIGSMIFGLLELFSLYKLFNF